jgi:hypothetical protein
MAMRRTADDDANTPASWRRLASFGAGSGSLAGFFGIGGGFLIVPGLVRAAGMSTAEAIATSLIAVTVFGAATARNYAVSGLVDWPVAWALIAGGLLRRLGGGLIADRLTGRRDLLRSIFSMLVAAMALAMLASTSTEGTHLMLRKIFQEHPETVGKTYAEHFHSRSRDGDDRRWDQVRDPWSASSRIHHVRQRRCSAPAHSNGHASS